MKPTFTRIIAKETFLPLLVVFAFLAAWHQATAQQSSVVIGVQKATSLNGPWNPLPISVSSLTPLGYLLDQTQTNPGFYRLNIAATNAPTGGVAVPLATASAQTLAQAELALSNNIGSNWIGAALAPYVYPIYDPAINQGATPAYLEFKVVPGASAGISNSFPNAPVLPTPDLGFILVSLTTQDVPVPELANEGPTMVEQLSQLAGTVNFKAMRYGHGLLVAEDTSGSPLAVIGELPFQPPGPISTFGMQSFQGLVVSNTVVSNTPPLTANPTGYASYQAFKEDYLSNPVWLYLQQRRAESGLFRWNLANGVTPTVLDVPLGVPTQVLAGVNVTGFNVQDPTVASGQILAASGQFFITGLTIAGTTLHVQMGGGATAYYILMVTNSPLGGNKINGNPTFGWGPWSYVWAGYCNQQRQYYQEENGGCLSGCGATAWSMLYGWWDVTYGDCNLIDNCPTPAPVSNDGGVINCQNTIEGMISTFCAFGQGATPPWGEGNGWQWAPYYRGYGIGESWTWGAPYLTWGAISTAENAIVSGRPAIVGVGFYEHYPLAWGYAWQQFFLFGNAVATSTYWFVNEGWGGNPCGGDWVDADSTWFGNNTTVY